MTTKTCHGSLHPEGAELSLDERYWHFHRSGRRKGTARHRCIDCLSAEQGRRGGRHGYVRSSGIRELANELVCRFGSIRRAALEAGVNPTTMWDLIHARRPWMQKRTAIKIVTATARERMPSRPELGNASDTLYLRSEDVIPLVNERIVFDGILKVARSASVDESTVRKLIGSNGYVTLRMADRVLTAVGRPDAVTDADWYSVRGENGSRSYRKVSV